MDECRADWVNGTKHRQALASLLRRERIKESSYNREYERCMTEEIPECLRRESARVRKTVAESERGERKQVLDGRRGKKVQDVPRRERETIEHM
jgi:hypothetical protein